MALFSGTPTKNITENIAVNCNGQPREYQFFSFFLLTNAKKETIIVSVSTYGEIAQLARAFGSYPTGRWFESTSRYQTVPFIGKTA